jgi:hypothetical protein
MNASFDLMYVLFNIQSPSPAFVGEGQGGQRQTERLTPVRDDTLL